MNRLATASAIALLALSCQHQPPSVDARRPEVVTVSQPNEPVATQVKHALGKAKRDGRKLLVYVSATWCEPCVRFHEAIDAGRLDSALPNLRLLEFDFDKHEERLADAKYLQQDLPLFTVPNPDGSPTQRYVTGAGKGPQGFAELTTKLEKLTEQR